MSTIQHQLLQIKGEFTHFVLGKQFYLFINPFASLRCWGNAFMAKPKTLTNRLTDYLESCTQSSLCRLDVLSVGVYDAIPHFNGEKATLDILELLKVDPGYYMTSLVDLSICVKNVHLFIGCRNHRKKNVGRCCVVHKKQQDKNIETEGTYMIRGAFKTQY